LKNISEKVKENAFLGLETLFAGGPRASCLRYLPKTLELLVYPRLRIALLVNYCKSRAYGHPVESQLLRKNCF
jgi:hypothetical protein